MNIRRALPPVYLFISIATMALLNVLSPIYNFVLYPWNLLGIVPLVAGITLNLMADAAFRKAQTTVKPFELSTALVTTGVFRISRHPMYLGMVLIQFGIAILMGSLAALIIVAIFAILMELVFVRTEEKILENQFGIAWVTYKNKVRKWL